MADSAPTASLADTIADRLDAVRTRIEAACARAERAPETVRLIAVTKTFGPEVVAAAIEAGLTDFGENRVQELDDKATAIPGTQNGGTVRWHLIGPLQRNKAKRAAELADAFHALDSDRLARELDKRAAAQGRVLDCFVQVNVSGEDSKSGLAPEDALAFIESVAPYEAIRVVGLMTLAAPAETDAELESVVRPQLAHLDRLARAAEDRLGRVMRRSMGMSGDFEAAVEEGATDIRLGSILFGAR